MHIVGKVVGFSNGILYGWIYDSNRLDERLVVEIWGDDYPIALTRAQAWMPELADIGDGCYGFYQSISAKKISFVNRLHAKLANTDYRLEGDIFLDNNPGDSQFSTALLGYVENKGGLLLHGWAYDPLVPDKSIELQIFEKNNLLGEVTANQKMADLLDLGVGEGKHGFEFTLPLNLANGEPHYISVLSKDGQALQGSPVVVVTYPQTIDDYLEICSKKTQDLGLIKFLAKQFRGYQEYAPLSVEFSAYLEWSNYFYGNSTLLQSKQQREFLVLVDGDGDLEKTLKSLLGQTYIFFKIIVKGPKINFSDPRIQFVDPADWENVVAVTIKYHVGLLSFIDAGDMFESTTLTQLNYAFDDPVVKMVYSDCLYGGASTTSAGLWFKPDWDLDLFLSQQLAHHAFAVLSDVISNDFRWITRPDAWPWLAVEAIGSHAKAIKHIPQILYHRSEANSLVIRDDVVEYFLPRIAPGVRIKRRLFNDSMRILEWPKSDEMPHVSLVIPTRDQQEFLEKCINSLKRTDYPNLDIIVVDNDTKDKKAVRYLSKINKNSNITVISYPHRFNYSAINNYAVRHAKGQIIGLLNNDVEAITEDWLQIMVTHLQRPNIGAVGAKLLWPNGMVQHAGVLLGLHGLAGHIGNDWEETDEGYWGYNQLTRRLNAVTAACLICYKDDYLRIGGLNEKLFPVAFNDVDFCLRLRELGKEIIWTPEAKLWHAESVSRGRDEVPSKQARLEKEKRALRELWGHQLYSDSYYNINLNLDRYSHRGLAFPPRKK